MAFFSSSKSCCSFACLLTPVPRRWKAEVRLGLQEALVNAVKHGNHLDPHKVISVRYRSSGNQYWWVIEDQGGGFDIGHCCHSSANGKMDAGSECGRGLYILHQIFDEVRWDQGGRELHLCKRVRRWFTMPLVC
ncbi:MAG: ATP-binding protein [Leptolyngbya sp. SIO1D8]|nr:ATP-binding protein [Leptolyngbya sp. SIO1D8]